MGAEEDDGAGRGPQRGGLGMTGRRAPAPRGDEPFDPVAQHKIEIRGEADGSTN